MPIGSQPPPPLVAAISYLIPGGGYWLTGERPRGLIVGITVLSLFVFGMLLGGVRAIEVPLFDEKGNYQDSANLVREIANKPWSALQVLCGPVAIAGGVLSIMAGEPGNGQTPALGALSHGRVNEIASLYMGVAGLLNLLAIIDAAHRANMPVRRPVRRSSVYPTREPGA